MNERIKIKTKATQPIIKRIEEIQLHLFESIYFRAKFLAHLLNGDAAQLAHGEANPRPRSTGHQNAASRGVEKEGRASAVASADGVRVPGGLVMPR